MGSEEDTTGLNAALAGVAYVVVLLDDRAVQLLPPSGTVTIGRAHEAQISIRHPSVSREHAVLDVDTMTITDVGSRNGTLVGGGRIMPHTPVVVGHGEPIVIGNVTMYIQHEDAMGPALASEVHDAPLELRLVDETARAARQGTTFVHVRVHVDPTSEVTARSVVAEGLRSSDVMTEEGGGRFQLLLPCTSGDRGTTVTQRLHQGLERVGVAARISTACYPYDGVTAAQLSAHAREQLALPAGTPCAMDALLKLTANVANSELAVLVTGETGAGKELIAEMIHRISRRAKGPFVRINCAAIAEQLLESELFGHARGAFTGADTARVGLLEAAAGGTVLLDELGEMSLRIQASLLRVIEERAVRRVGETESRSIDVRFVCATNRSLADEVDAGRFRRDLYYRISGITIAVPPLRERVSAIEPIARAFAALASGQRRRRPPRFSDEALELLRSSPWPGNIRELKNAVDRAVLLAGAELIRPADLAIEREPGRSSQTMITEDGPTISPPLAKPVPAYPAALADELAELEKRRITETLERFGGNQTRAARALGVSRTTLIARMDAYGLRRPRKD